MEALYLKKLGGLVSLLESIAARLEENFSELAALNQPRMLRLWFDMLGRMLKREVELKPDAVLPVLADVLTRLSDKNSVVIYVSPEDTSYLFPIFHHFLLSEVMKDPYIEHLHRVQMHVLIWQYSLQYILFQNQQSLPGLLGVRDHQHRW